MNWISDKEYDAIYSKVPRVCIDLVIKSNNGVLLIKRDAAPYKGKWHLPGGRIGFRENIKKAANRIALKEIGASVEIVGILGYMEFLMEKQAGNKRHTVSLVFEATIKKYTKGKVFYLATKDILSVHTNFLKSKNIIE